MTGEEDQQIHISHDIQNELLKVMVLSILRDIAKNIQKSCFFTIMWSECTDAANKEQVVICIRWVDSNLEVFEDVIGLYAVDDVKATTITNIIKDTLLRLNPDMKKCWGQCYDEVSNMSGPKTELPSSCVMKNQE